MTKEELERLYMDIYDNGISDNDYKEKFKRYVNSRLESLEKENKDLRDNYEQYKAVAKPEIDRLNKEYSKLEGRIQYWTSEYYKLEYFMKNKLAEAKEIIKDLLGLKSSISSAKDAESRFAVREKAKKLLEAKE